MSIGEITGVADVPKSLDACCLRSLAGRLRLLCFGTTHAGRPGAAGPTSGIDQGEDVGGETLDPLAVANRKLIRTGELRLLVDEYEPLQL